MKGFLDDPPTFGRPEKSEKIRHANARTGQFTRPVRDFELNHSDRFEDVHAYDARFNIRGWSVSINPIEQEFRSNGQLPAGITEERGLRVEGGTHHFAAALFAAVDVQLEGLQDLVMLGRRLHWCHAARIRSRKSGHQGTSMVKEGALSVCRLSSGMPHAVC